MEIDRETRDLWSVSKVNMSRQVLHFNLSIDKFSRQQCARLERHGLPITGRLSLSDDSTKAVAGGICGHYGRVVR